MSIAKLKQRKSYIDDICEFIREQIYIFKLKPGSQISEISVMNDLGVSRSPVREAIRILEGEGLVERILHKGVFVKKTSIKDIEEIFSIRVALEELAVAQAMPKLTDDDLSNLNKLLEKMKKALAKDDSKLYMRQNLAFHQCIRNISQNDRLIKLLELLNQQSMGFMYTTVSLEDSLEISFEEHKKIYEMLKERNLSKALNATREHIINGGERIKRILMENYLSDVNCGAIGEKE